MNLEAVEIEVDAKAIVDLIANGNNSNNFISFLIDDCKTWLPGFPIRRLVIALE